MDRRFRLKPYTSKFMTTLRFLDALVAPAVLLALFRLDQLHIGERAITLAVVSAFAVATSMEAVGLYRRWRGAQLRREVHTILAGWALAVAIALIAGLAVGALAAVPATVLAGWFVLTPFTIAGIHGAGRRVLRFARQKGYNHRKAVIVGAGDVGKALARKLNATPWAGIEILGFVDDDPAKLGATIEGAPVLAPTDAVEAVIESHRPDILYLALPMRAELKMRRILDLACARGVAVYMVPDIFIFDLLGSRILDVDGIPLVSLSESPQIGPAGAIKRLEDLILASLGLLVLSPLFLVIAILIKRSSPGPVFFGHERIGQNGRKFKCYKFRTMVPNAQEVLQELLDRDPEARKEWDENFKLKNDPRITPIGRFLRKTSLDELPQLWNVIKGEMSLVGPRPIVEAEIPKYGRHFRHLSMVRPGMTGLWQISGRNDLSYEERVQLDVQYARGWSVMKDLYIIVKTVKAVLAGAGSY